MAKQPSYLYVKNWDELQHYKTRRPPWIKLYRRLLTDWEFLELTESAQLQLIKIWIISAENLPGGWIQNDPKLVRALTQVAPKLHSKLPELVAKGWLLPRNQAQYDEARASIMLASRYQNASPLVQRLEIYNNPPKPSTSTTDVEGQEGFQNGKHELPDLNAILKEMPA